MYTSTKGDQVSVMSTGLGGAERPTARRTYTIDEAAELLGLGRNSAYLAAQRGDLPVIRIGKRLLIPRLALDRMLSGEGA
jgi:excisionase family DNA binding protein